MWTHQSETTTKRGPRLISWRGSVSRGALRDSVNDGKHGDRQILYAPRIRELLAGSNPRGFPTGEKLPVGETTYINAFWVTSYVASHNCRVFYPRMIGWGGNIVALMPGGLTAIRLAKSGETADNSEVDTSGMAQVANFLSRFCH